MNPLDLVAILLVVVAVILGFQSGALPQVGGLLGAVGGGALVVLALPHLVEPLEAVPVSIRPYVVLGGLLMAVGIGESVGSAIGRTGARSLGGGFLGAADRLAGSVTGLRRRSWSSGWRVGYWPSDPSHGSARLPRHRRRSGPSTRSCPADRDRWRPRPPAERLGPAGRLRRFRAAPETARRHALGYDRRADRRGGRGKHGPGPSWGLWRTGVGHGRRRRRGLRGDERPRCGRRARWCHRRRDSSRRPDRCARGPVRSGTRRRAPLGARPAGEPLRFASGDPDRGAVGAALGYPGGGSLTIVPAAVTGAYRATGRDIYGEARVDRDILELRATIDRGDSGGPFVLEDGTIGGLVFAEARSDPEVGYALTPTSVAIRIAPSIGRTGPVATGSCLG